MKCNPSQLQRPATDSDVYLQYAILLVLFFRTFQYVHNVTFVVNNKNEISIMNSDYLWIFQSQNTRIPVRCKVLTGLLINSQIICNGTSCQVVHSYHISEEHTASLSWE
jgi:hypothetical protein